MAARPLGVPASRDGSGTAWLPDRTPVEGWHGTAGAWSLMAHGNAFLQYFEDTGERGHEGFGSIHWVMGMAERPALGGSLTLRAMVSAERLTVGECGYPDLLATGETCDGGRRIVDQQHPHDLFMELAVRYSRAVTDGLAFELYGGPVAEPALGPGAYPHRPSALPNPAAPITHHWLDATHIAFGVATAGLYGRWWKVEGSLFNGREPDEDRYDLDLAALDSYAGRVTLMPTEGLVLQVSAGHLAEAEVSHDGGTHAENGAHADEGHADEGGHGVAERIDVDRYTASVIHHGRLAGGPLTAATVAVGRNVEHGEGTNAVLAEAVVGLASPNSVFARAEAVEKTAGSLLLPGGGDEVHVVSKLTLGYTRRLLSPGGLVVSAGGSVSVGLVPEELESVYGGRSIPGFGVFLRISPPPVGHGAPAGH